MKHDRVGPVRVDVFAGGHRPPALGGSREGGAGEVRVGPNSSTKISRRDIDFAHRSYTIRANRTAQRIDPLDNAGRATGPNAALAIDRYARRPMLGHRHRTQEGPVIF